MKKLFSILSAAVIVLSVAAVMAFAVGDGKNRGDVNGDGKMDLIAKEKTPAGSWSVAIGTGAAFVPQSQPL